MPRECSRIYSTESEEQLTMITNKISVGQDQGVTRAVARFGLGQVVVHKLFNHRGVIIDIDPVFLGPEDWYEQLALVRPVKNQPWYKVLVSDTNDEAYLPEQDISADSSEQQINHPLLGDFFNQYDNGHYKNTGWKLH